MLLEVDALVVGAGPAGAASAILLARGGWRVALVEQHATPPRKVCGECISAGTLELLDRLGIGAQFRSIAGPELANVAWMRGRRTVIATLPRCTDAADHYGRALGRDRLDALLVAQARASGAVVVQPARIATAHGEPGRYICKLEPGFQTRHSSIPWMCDVTHPRSISARVLVAAHGSWEREPPLGERTAVPRAHEPRLDSDLLAFKANFSRALLAPGQLAVLAFPGGYGGMVVANGGSATVACCIRRDVLRVARAQEPELAAGAAVEVYLQHMCRGVAVALSGARRDGPWLAAGPIRPGIRVWQSGGSFPVGNAAGETHPLIGEGISMALQSAVLLTRHLLRVEPHAINESIAARLKADYARDWCNAFATRARFAAAYAYIAMRPPLAAPISLALARWPGLLTQAAQWVGKARPALVPLGV